MPNSLSDEIRDEIRQAVDAALQEACHDVDTGRSLIESRYAGNLEALDFAKYLLNRSARPPGTRTIDDDHSPLWKKIAKDDDTDTFRVIEKLNIVKRSARFFKVTSPRGITMFMKYLRESDDINNSMRVAAVLREYQKYCLFRDPNVVDVYDVGWVQCDDGSEHPYVATQFLEGVNLEQWRLHHYSPTLRESVECVRVIAATLHRLRTVCRQQAENEAQRQNTNAKFSDFLHLDIKPENIMIVRRSDGSVGAADEESIRLVDFGSAGSPGTANARGTRGYLASERHLPKEERPSANPTWDIFSLGAVLYFLHTGRHPTPIDEMEPDEWEAWLNRLDVGNSDITKICRKCLAWSSCDRYRSPLELEEDLAAWLTDNPLPHIRKHDYAWWEKEALLHKRCSERNARHDHLRLATRTASVLAVLAAIVAMLNVCFVQLGAPSPVAFRLIGDAHAVVSVIVALSFLWLGRFHSESVRIYIPFAALVVATTFTVLWNIPGSPLAPHTNTQLVDTVKYFLLLMGVGNVFYSHFLNASRFALLCAWFTMLFPVVIHFYAHAWIFAQYAAVFPYLAETVLCVTFARNAMNNAKNLELHG